MSKVEGREAGGAPPAGWLAFVRTDVGEGAQLFLWSTQKFKTTTVRVLLRRPLGEGTSAGALLPMILQRGTRRLPETMLLARRLDMLYGAELRADVMKFGEEQVSIFHLEVAHRAYVDGEDPLPEAMGILADVLTDPPLPGGGLREDWLAQERDNLRRRILGIRSDKAHYAQVRLVEEMCRGELYAIPRLGSLEDLEKPTASDLWAHWQSVLREAPIVVYMVGDLRPDVAEEHARRLLERLGRRRVAVPPAPAVHPAPPEPREVVEREDVAQGKLALGFTAPCRAGDAAYPALSMLNGVYGGFSHSRLFQEVRERHSLAYYATSQVDGLKGLVFVHLGIAPENRRAAQGLVLGELDALRRGEARADELRDTLKGMATQIRQSVDAPGEAIMTDFELRAAGRPTEPEERIAALEAVRPEQVAEAAQGLVLDTVYFLDAEEGRGGDAH